MPDQETKIVPSPDWQELKGRLFHFLGAHPTWARWQDSEGVWFVGREGWEDHEHAKEARVEAVLQDRKLIPSRSIPERHAFRDITSRGWNRLLLGVFTYLGGPVRLGDLVTVTGFLLDVPGSMQVPPGVAVVEGPDGSAGHLTVEQMEAVVGGAEEPREHAAGCPFCARQLAAFEAAAPALAEPLKAKAAPVEEEEEAPRHPGAPETGFFGRLFSVLESPMLMFTIVGGLTLLLGGPYLMWRAVAPPEGNPFTEEANAQAEDVPLDLSAVDQLEEPFHSGALAILEAAVPEETRAGDAFGGVDPLDAREPVLPGVLFSLTAPVGFGLQYPVTEAVPTGSVAFQWQAIARPPYSVEVRNARNQVVAKVAQTPNAEWAVPQPLEPGMRYTWSVRFGDGTEEKASFLVLSSEQLQQWRAAQAQFGESPLVMGLIAYQLGLLSEAEYYFNELIAANPRSRQAVRLLENLDQVRQ